MLKTAPSVSRKSTSTALAAPELNLRSARPSAQPHSRLTRLQSVHGNQSVQRQLDRGILQAKLTVNQPGDVYEQEADRVADAVMRMSVSGASGPPWQPNRGSAGVQRCSCGGSGGETGQCQECKENEKEMSLHRVESSSSQIDTAPPIVSEVISSPGQPLDASTRAFMEPRMGHDFGQVRVHTGAQAADSAKAVNALAYTVGTNVVFGAGQYAPSSPAGQRLLAHELTHTLQQTSASALRVARAPSTGKCETFNYPRRKAGVSAVPGKSSIDDQGVTGITGTSFERFAESSNSLTPIHLAQIASLQLTLAAADTVEVHGYASCDGGAEFNLGLSSDRAEAVKKALTTTGKSPFIGTVTTLAHGETNEFGATLDANRRAIVVVHHVTPKPCPRCPEEPRTEGCPPCPPQPEPPVFFCNKEITLSLIHRQGHAFFRVGGSAPGNPTFELEHDERGDHCACGFQGIPQRDFKEDVDATDAKCVAAPGISASCLAKNWNTYPIGKYCALGLNSNTYARFLAEKCGGKGLKPPGGVRGFDDSPPTAGTANDTSTVFTLRCNEIRCDDQSCLPPTPPPPDRGTQVECVKDLGLCGIPGGIPSAEDIHRWNEECRRRTGYTGEDITTEECANVNLQRKEASGETSSLTNAGTNTVQNVMSSPGQPLDHKTRDFMEPRFGADFSHIRVHTDAQAAESAKAAGAIAYTVRNHIVFDDNTFSPQTPAGQRLFAHELTHTIQQGPTELRRQVSGSNTKQPCNPPPGLSCTADPNPLPPGNPESILFAKSSAKVPDAIEKRIPGFAQSVLQDQPNAIFKIDGFSSLDGGCDFNWKLSCDRAQGVAADLVAAGAASVTTTAHGPTGEFSKVPGDDANNRRVTITVMEPCPNGTVVADQDPLPPVPPFNPKILPADEVFERVKKLLPPGQPVPENPPLGASQPSFTNNPVKISAVPVPDSDCLKCVADWDLSASFESLISSGPIDSNEPKIFEGFQKDSQEGCPFHALPVLLPVRRMILPESIPITITAEREHYNDFVEAFHIVGGRYLSNVRRLTPDRTHIRAQNQAECEDKVLDFLFNVRGGLPFLTPFLPRFSENFVNDFTKLFLLPDRDRKDGPHFANPSPSFKPFQMPIRPNIDRDKNPFGCNAFFRKYDRHSGPGIPGPASATIIKDTARPLKQPWHLQ